VKRFITLLQGLAVLAALCLAHAANAAPVGSMSCSTATGSDIKFNVSFFTAGITNSSVGTSGSGAGAGKAKFEPLEVHAALSTFETLFTLAYSGTVMRNCTLTTTTSDGATVEYEFQDIAITALTAYAEKRGTLETPAQYTDVQFEYLRLLVKYSGGADDGGTNPTVSSGNRND